MGGAEVISGNNSVEVRFLLPRLTGNGEMAYAPP